MSLIFLILALVAFIAACIPVSSRINLVALGLAFLTAAQLVGVAHVI